MQYWRWEQEEYSGCIGSVVMHKLHRLRDAGTRNKDTLEFFNSKMDVAPEPPWQRACIQQEPLWCGFLCHWREILKGNLILWEAYLFPQRVVQREWYIQTHSTIALWSVFLILNYSCFINAISIGFRFYWSIMSILLWSWASW